MKMGVEMNQLLVQMQGIVKRFPGVQALGGVDFDLRPGEVHVLLGENGAGKSTLIKILAGVYSKDEGRIFIQGQEVHHLTPKMAQDLGIRVIYQEFNLMPYFTVAENLFMGREPLRNGRLIDWKKVYKEAQEILDRLDCPVSPRRLVRDLSVADKQMVEIARALSVDSRVIVMDEPTSALSMHEIEKLFQIIHLLKQKGVGIIYISHRLEEINRVGDRVTVLRDGHWVGTRKVGETNVDELIKMMVGRELKAKYPYEKREIKDEVVLQVKNFTSRGQFQNINLSLRRGEILGIAGLVGAGRTELARAIMGLDPIDEGTVEIFGKEIRPKAPRNMIQHGLGLLPEDRKGQGVTQVLPLIQNITIVALHRVFKKLFINFGLERKLVTDYVQKLNIATPSLQTQVMYLSGGNQQKIVVAKWLFSQGKILIFDEPTRGIDVGSKFEVHQIMMNLVKDGNSIIMISSELPEILGMSDRILVMQEGRLTGELKREEATQEKILRYAMVEEVTEGSATKREEAHA
jgi:ribose transport system ATP-binding protein